MSIATQLWFRVRRVLAALSRPPRRVAARIRNALDRALHPRRHRRAVRAVVEAQVREPVANVLFVCLGNICRSPYAEGRLREDLARVGGAAARVKVASSGFLSPGRPSPRVAVEVANERGVDLTARRSGTLTNDALRDADLVFVMTGRQQRDMRGRYGRPDTLHLGDLEPPPIPRRDLPDPYGRPGEDFHAVYRRIDRAVAVLAELLGGEPGTDPPTIEAVRAADVASTERTGRSDDARD